MSTCSRPLASARPTTFSTSAAARDTTRVAARHAIRGRAVGIDLSAPMPELARCIAVEEVLGNITFERDDVAGGVPHRAGPRGCGA
jgi:hypothetical protein